MAIFLVGLLIVVVFSYFENIRSTFLAIRSKSESFVLRANLNALIDDENVCSKLNFVTSGITVGAYAYRSIISEFDRLDIYDNLSGQITFLNSGRFGGINIEKFRLLMGSPLFGQPPRMGVSLQAEYKDHNGTVNTVESVFVARLNSVGQITSCYRSISFEEMCIETGGIYKPGDIPYCI